MVESVLSLFSGYELLWLFLFVCLFFTVLDEDVEGSFVLAVSSFLGDM